MSAAGKARIIAALKKRWAAYHKATQEAKPAAKKAAVRKRAAKKAATKASGAKSATPPPAPAA